MKKATIYDYARLCEYYGDCESCPLSEKHNGYQMACFVFVTCYSDEANEIILKWCEENLIETRQDRFLTMFPHVRLSEGIVTFCPRAVDNTFPCPVEGEVCGTRDCAECRRNYWLEEVEE